MKKLKRDDMESRLRLHLREVLSLEPRSCQWDGQSALPEYLKEFYTFLPVKLLGSPCLFLLDRGTQRGTPSAIRKHIAQVTTRWSGDVVYVASAVDSARRSQLIAQKVPFVVPGNQVYLPMMGIDLREHFRKMRKPTTHIGPAAQMVLLHVLHNPETVLFSPGELALTLGCTPMTMTRALDEIEDAGLGRHYIQGRRRFFEIKEQRKLLWEKVRPLLRSPAVRRVRVAEQDSLADLPQAGLSAAAVLTNLAPPERPVVAAGSRIWRKLREHVRELASEEDDASSIQVEIWSYPPESIARGPTVDRLSLYLSLEHSDDERVDGAREEILEGMRW